MVLVLLALLIILAVLFVPVRYKFKGRYLEDKYFVVNFRWLFSLLHVKVEYKNDKVEYKFTVFGVKINLDRKSKTKKGKRRSKNKKDVEKDKPRQKENLISKSANIDSEKFGNNINNAVSGTIDVAEADNDLVSKLDDSHDDIYSIGKNLGFLSKYKRFQLAAVNKINKVLLLINNALIKVWKIIKSIFMLPWVIADIVKIIYYKILYFCHNVDKLIDKIKRIYSFLSNQDTKDGIKSIKGYIKVLCKHVLPRRMKANLQVGTGDPCSTGYLLGVLGALMPIYKDKVNIVPDFNEKVLKGTMSGKGKITAFKLLLLGIKVYKDEKVMGLVDEGKNVLGGE